MGCATVICGWGCLNRKLPGLFWRYGDGHADIERTLRFVDGRVFRYQEFCAKTRCKQNKSKADLARSQGLQPPHTAPLLQRGSGTFAVFAAASVDLIALLQLARDHAGHRARLPNLPT